MSLSLSNDDRCAVDLLLEHAQPGQSMSPCFTQAPSAELQQRLSRVEKILHLLDLQPVSEPPVDLVAKTMARIDSTAPVRMPDGPVVPVAVVR